MREHIQKLRRNLRDYGVRVTFRKILARLLSPVFESRTYRIYRIDLEKRVLSRGHGPSGFTFKWLDRRDREAIRQIEDEAEWLRGVLGRMLAGGALCFTAWRGDRLAGFNLIDFGEVSIPLLERNRRFRPSEAWSSHIAVLKDFRRKHLARELRCGVFDELRKRNIKKLYGGTLASNLPAIRLTRNVGFTEFADVRLLKVFHARTWRYTKVTPRDRSIS